MSEEHKLRMGRRGLLAVAGALAASPLLAAAPSPKARRAHRASSAPVSGRRRLGSLEVSSIGLGVQNNYRKYTTERPYRPEQIELIRTASIKA
jgi:hypothetical protein